MKTPLNIANLPKNLKLLAVTKGRTVPEILKMLIKTKLTRIGENRIEEAEEKLPILETALQANTKLEKHFIGKIQSRKIRRIVALFDTIQSVENLTQAEKISKAAKEFNKTIQIFLQINLTGLPQRAGAKPKEAMALIQEIQKLPNTKLIGVMGIASEDRSKAKAQFALLKSLQNDLPECSMGMSKDYDLAIKAGSTMLRLGSALFE